MIVKKFNLEVHEYTEEFNDNDQYQDDITMVIFESGRFIFLDGVVVSEMYHIGKCISIANRNGHKTYSTVKELYQLKKQQLSDNWEEVKHFYGKEWISGRGYGTKSAEYVKKYYPEIVNKNMDFIPEKSDCPQCKGK